MGLAIWICIVGGIAISLGFLCYCFRCVRRELRIERSTCCSLICIAEPPPPSNVVEIGKTRPIRLRKVR